MECGDLSPLLWAATCRGQFLAETIERPGVKPPWTKAMTGHRTPRELSRVRQRGMKMAQWNPLHDLVSLQDRMNRLFEDASQRRASEAKPSDEVEGADWYPAADVCENDGTY